MIVGELRGPSGGVIVASNHSASPVASTLRLPEGVATVDMVGPTAIVPADVLDGAIPLDLEPHGVAVAAWRR